jgi:hypothetical protein
MGIVSSLICLFGRSRTNADDRLPADPLSRVEGRNGIVEGRDVADLRPQPSVPHPLDDLTQSGTIGQDNEVDRGASKSSSSQPASNPIRALAIGPARSQSTAGNSPPTMTTQADARHHNSDRTREIPGPDIEP